MKKKPKLIEEAKQKFYEEGKKLGTREEMLDYVWQVQIKRQLGYSFSLNHTMPYSCICVQGMNLAYHYPIIFWNCACLSINSGGGDEDLENKSTEYGRIATAIGNIQKAGQKIVLPNINKAQ